MRYITLKTVLLRTLFASVSWIAGWKVQRASPITTVQSDDERKRAARAEDARVAYRVLAACVAHKLVTTAWGSVFSHLPLPLPFGSCECIQAALFFVCSLARLHCNEWVVLKRRKRAPFLDRKAAFARDSGSGRGGLHRGLLLAKSYDSMCVEILELLLGIATTGRHAVKR